MKNKTSIMLLTIIISSHVLLYNLSAQEMEIKGAKISLKSEAKQVAVESYLKKCRNNLTGLGGIRLNVITIGICIDKFAEVGTKVWEAKFYKPGSEALSAIIWIHPNTGKAHYVIGPWIILKKEFKSDIISKKKGSSLQLTIVCRHLRISACPGLYESCIRARGIT